MRAFGKIDIFFDASMNPIELKNYNSDKIFIYFEKYDANLAAYVPALFNMTWEVVKFTG
jgi:hypothetical protein